MIKVCHMTSAHGEEDVRIFHKECVSLAKAGYDTYLVERGGSREKDGVHIIGVGEIPQSRRKRMTEGARKVYEAARAVDADIYHFHDPELLPYGLKLKRAGKRVIFDSHENYSEQMKSKPYLPAWCSAVLAALYRQYERFVVKQLDAVIYPCTFLGKLLYENVCPRVVLLDNVACLSEIYDLCQNTEPIAGKPACFVGTLSPMRCVSEIIQAAISENLPLLLVGAFSSEAYQEECLASIEGHSNIRWVGGVPHAEAIELMRGCSAGLCPEKNSLQYNTVDNLATKSYEYMALGLPVIVAAYPFSKKIMEEYHYGLLVDPDSAEDIAHAMRYLYDHPQEAYQMGQNGRRAIKERFNWDSEEKKLLALYEDILKS